MNSATGYLPDRPRPAWFRYALSTLFVTSLVIALAGSLRAPGPVNPFENRTVEPLPAPPGSVRALREYPARFERFFDDRFGMRSTLVHFDHWTRARVFGVSPVPKVLLGQAGWLFFTGEDAKAFDRWYRGSDPVPDAAIAAARDELVRRAAFLAGRGIPFVVVIVPEKYTIYPEFLPDWASARSPRAPLDRLAVELAAQPQLHFIDLRGPLSRGKVSERLYYQTDSHWNYLGASVGYTQIMREVARLLPASTIAPVVRPPYVAGVDYYSGDLAQMLGLPRQFREEDVAPLGKVLATPQARCAKQERSAAANVETFVYRCPDPPRYSALVYRDSMGIPLMPMLAENFVRTTFVTSAKLDPQQVDALKPDIVIEEMVERASTSPALFPMPR